MQINGSKINGLRIIDLTLTPLIEKALNYEGF